MVLYAKITEGAINKTEKIFGNNQPPKKNKAINADIKIIFAYSAKKNIANVIDAYSVL
jgi:hypothetical protein